MRVRIQALSLTVGVADPSLTFLVCKMVVTATLLSSPVTGRPLSRPWSLLLSGEAGWSARLGHLGNNPCGSPQLAASKEPLLPKCSYFLRARPGG